MESSLHLTWHDSALIPLLNPANVLDYFSERSNPFYDRQCNNEVVKMQRLSIDQLDNMVGMEYKLIHAQEPILYVIRQQYRQSPTQVTPFAHYYIIAGVVHQAPDLHSVITSRMANCVHNLETAFDEAQSFSRYHPSKGYSWEFKDKQPDKASTKEKKRRKEEPSSVFQRQRVDMLLTELAHKYPARMSAAVTQDVKPDLVPKLEPKVEVKTEKAERAPLSSQNSVKPPPEKKTKPMR